MMTQEQMYQELIDRLNEMTQCMVCFVPILEEHRYSSSDALRQIDISNSVIAEAKAIQKENA